VLCGLLRQFIIHYQSSSPLFINELNGELNGMAGRGAWRRIFYIVGIVFGLSLLAQQTWQGVTALQQYNQQAQLCVLRPSYLIGALGLYIAAYFVQMVAWALIMRSLQAPLAPGAVLKGYAISFLPRYIPGTVWGYLSRNEWLAQTYGIGYAVSTVASLLEASMLLVTAIALGTFYWVDAPWKLPVAGLGIVATGLTWLVVPWLASRLSKQRLQVEANASQRWRPGLLILLLYLLFWVIQGGAILYVGATLCANSSTGLSESGLLESGLLDIGLLEGMAAVGLSWALGFVILFVPAGLGIREWSLSTLLIIFSGIEPGQAAMIAVISRVALICAEIVVLLLGVQSYIRGWWSKRG
jgi:hypothetical protein